MTSLPIQNFSAAVGSSLPCDEQFCLRKDLQWIAYQQRTKVTWVARDPLTLEYYYFSELEKRFLHLLDSCSIQTALAQLNEASANPFWAQQLVARVEQAGLLVRRSCIATGQGQRLWQQAKRRSQAMRLGSLLNPVSIRIRLFDPSRLLSKADWLARLLLGRWTCLAVGLAWGIVGWLLLMRMTSGGAFQSSGNGSFGIVWNWQLGIQLLIAYAVVKSLHELGHAIACRFHGVACHELGVMLLLFMPCLYCDTSDSWKLPNRWRRAAIAAAGVYVELILALMASLVWLMTHPNSAIHVVAASVMIAATVSTILVNANPLLRYDGYYILSDLLAVPNLAQQSRSALRATVAKLFVGSSTDHSSWDAPRWFLVPYAIASSIYQTAMLGLIMLAAWTLFDQTGLRLAGVAVLGVFAIGYLYGLVRSLGSIISTLSYSTISGSLRALSLGLVLAIVFGWLLAYQAWPTWIAARGVAEIKQLKPVYVREAGVLKECLDARHKVEEGAVIARLKSFELEQELTQVDGGIKFLEEKLAQLKLQILSDDQSAAKLGETVQQIAKLRGRRDIVTEQIAELTIKATHAGLFIPNMTQPSPVLTQAVDRTAWRPVLDSSNLECTLERGTLLGWIAPSLSYQLTSFVEQGDAELVSPGMSVTIRWDGLTKEVYSGRVVSVASEPVESTPVPLLGDESFLSESTSEGEIRPVQPHYIVYIELDSAPHWLFQQCKATVHIHTHPRTLWQSLVRQYQLNVQPKFSTKPSR